MKTRTLPLLALGLLVSASAHADYQYFYPCALGVIDCNAFPTHYYGDFGMSGIQQVSTPGGVLTAPVEVDFSNSRGEIIGGVDTGTGAPSPVFGFGGHVSLISNLSDPLVFDPVDINNNGYDLFNDVATSGNFVAWLSDSPLNSQLDRASIAAQLGVEDVGGDGGQFRFSFAYGINDQNQVVAEIPVEIDGQWLSVKGVLSDFAVPEPSSLLLLATVALMGGLTQHTRPSTISQGRTKPTDLQRDFL